MKIKCNSNDFIKLINQASKIVSKSNINPIFECLYIKAEDHLLTIKSSNLEIVYEKSINVLGEINGSFYVKAEMLNKIASNLEKNNPIEVFMESNRLTIKNKKEVIEIDIFDISDSFPNMPIKNENILSIKIGTFLENIKNVSFASSKSEIKPEIASVYFYNKDDFIFFVATDSYRLAEKREDKNYIILKDFNIILPIKNIANIISILEDEDKEKDIEINTYQDGIIFENNDIFISSRVVSGNFPDYKQLFPKLFNVIFEMDKSEVVKALNFNNLITTQYNFSKLKYNAEENLLDITAEEKSRGNIKSVLSFISKDREGNILNENKNNKEGNSQKENNLEGSEQEKESRNNLENNTSEIKEVSYNTGYFLEGLSKINSSKILMSYTLENKPVFIRNNNDLSFTYLLMPLNR